MSDRQDAKRGNADLIELISFRIGNEEYGLQIQRVKEVIRTRDVTRLPKAPSFIMGVVNLRGDVIPIVDLREKFGLQPSADTTRARVIVVDFAQKSVGIRVDVVNQVVRLQDDRIEPPPPIVGGIPTELITGVGKIDDRLIVLLDIDRVLSVKEQQVLQQMDSSHYRAELHSAHDLQDAQ